MIGTGTTLWMVASYLRVPEVPFVGQLRRPLRRARARRALGPRVPVVPESLFRSLAVSGRWAPSSGSSPWCRRSRTAAGGCGAATSSRATR